MLCKIMKFDYTSQISFPQLIIEKTLSSICFTYFMSSGIFSPLSVLNSATNDKVESRIDGPGFVKFSRYFSVDVNVK